MLFFDEFIFGKGFLFKVGTYSTKDKIKIISF